MQDEDAEEVTGQLFGPFEIDLCTLFQRFIRRNEQPQMCEITKLEASCGIPKNLKVEANFCTANCRKLRVGDKDPKIASLLMGKLAFSRHIIYFAAPLTSQLVTRSNSHQRKLYSESDLRSFFCDERSSTGAKALRDFQSCHEAQKQ